MLDNPDQDGQPAYWKSRSAEHLSGSLVAHLVDAFKQRPFPESTIMIEHYHGAFEDRGGDVSAYPFRRRMINVLAIGAHQMRHDHDNSIATEAAKRWAGSVTDFTESKSIGSPYINYLSEDELPAWRQANPHMDRLRVMQRYLDPFGILARSEYPHPSTT
jgi:hypothetical protein